MRFTSPVMICGLLCNWLEFKTYFGFPHNLFVSSSGKSQLKKYVGPGTVVYSQGFQCNPNIEDVSLFATSMFSALPVTLGNRGSGRLAINEPFDQLNMSLP
jgi:hypothetical protein